MIKEAFADWIRGSRLHIAFLRGNMRPEPPPPKVTASKIILAVDTTQSSVHWTVHSTLHTVHGTFAIKSGSLQFGPGTERAGGEIMVYATSGENGNKSRDARVCKEILIQFLSAVRVLPATSVNLLFFHRDIAAHCGFLTYSGIRAAGS